MAYGIRSQWAIADLEQGLIYAVWIQIARHEEKLLERFARFPQAWLDALGQLLSLRRP